MASDEIKAVTLDAIRARRDALGSNIVRTPVLELHSPLVTRLLDGGSLYLKLECFQHTGTFKARGALSVAYAIPQGKRTAGITAASAGNHAIAAAWAARQLGLSAKVVMQSSASPLRVALAQAQGAQVIIREGGAATFAEAERLVREEGRSFIHPFEGLDTALGTAGVGLEFLEDVPELEAVVVSVGGGGLIGGVAAACKALSPGCKVYGVEPAGADSMSRSLAEGAPVTLDRLNTVADSLAPPMALPFSYGLCAAFVDHLATVDDDQICAGMAVLQEEARLAVEPAAGAALAGLLAPLRGRLKGRKVGLVVCGTNIDTERYIALLRRGTAAVDALTSPASAENGCVRAPGSPSAWSPE